MTLFTSQPLKASSLSRYTRARTLDPNRYLFQTFVQQSACANPLGETPAKEWELEWSKVRYYSQKFCCSTTCSNAKFDPASAARAIIAIYNDDNAWNNGKT